MSNIYPYNNYIWLLKVFLHATNKIAKIVIIQHQFHAAAVFRSCRFTQPSAPYTNQSDSTKYKVYTSISIRQHQHPAPIAVSDDAVIGDAQVLLQ